MGLFKYPSVHELKDIAMIYNDNNGKYLNEIVYADVIPYIWLSRNTYNLLCISNRKTYLL